MKVDLSDHQMLTLKLYVFGHTHKEIADLMGGISHRTVGSQLQTIRRKMQARNPAPSNQSSRRQLTLFLQSLQPDIEQRLRETSL